MVSSEADADRRALYRAAGISAIVLAVLYIAITGLYVTAGLVPTDVEARLTYLAANEPAWWAIVWLSVFTDLLYVPIALAMYVALASINRNAMLAGTGLLVLFVILDLAITWPNYAALVELGVKYVAASSDAQRGAIVATASYPMAILDTSLLAAYIILVPGLGALIIGLVMLRSIFGRVPASLGVATGLAGIVAVVGPFIYEPLGTLAIFAAVLTLIWFFVSGLRLLRLSRPEGG
jgi:Domain of unknown function (DUF4386)